MAFGFLVLGVAAAALVGKLVSGDLHAALWVVQQFIVAGSVVVGLAIFHRHTTLGASLRACFAAWIAFVGSVALLVVISMSGVFDHPFLIEAASSALMSFGWYPRGADVWFPMAVVIWCLSTLGITIISAVAARVFRGAFEHRLNG